MHTQEILLEEIINLCLSIERSASKIYAEFSRTSQIDELRTFWKEMAEEEISHIKFWLKVIKILKTNGLPPVFEDPLSTRDELVIIESKAREFVENRVDGNKLEDKFTIAYRIEFYMLHPAFETLFHVLKTSVGDLDPEDAYEEHINSFIDMLSRHGTQTPELELLGETIRRLWKENRKLVTQVNSDPLTKILNKRGVLLIARQLYYLAQRNQENIGVLMIDVDNFKSINDAYGHTRGDQVLKAIAGKIMDSTRKSDVVGRWGGDEFIVLIPGSTPRMLSSVAEKIRMNIATTKIFGSSVTVSIGASQDMVLLDEPAGFGFSTQEVDQHLYSAKQKGRNQVVTEV